MKDKPVAEQEIGKQMLSETASFAETSSCRRKFILHYFGEDFEETKCAGMCDNCRHPKQKFEAQDRSFERDDDDDLFCRFSEKFNLKM